jgi:hypothetical protein
MDNAAAATIKKPDQTVPAGLVVPQTNQVTPQISQLPPAVRAGVTGATSGETPPTGAAADIGSALASLINKFMPGSAEADPAVACAEAMAKILSAQGTATNEQIRVENAKRGEVFAAKLKQAEDALAQLAQVKDTSWWDDIKVVVEAVVAVAAIYAGVVLQAVPGGDVLGVLLIVAGSLELEQCTDDATKMATGHGLVGNFVLETHLGDANDANDADTVAEVTVAVAQIAVGIATCCVGDPQGLHSGIINLAAALTTAAGDAAVAVITYENAGHEAEAKRDKAKEAQSQEVADLIDEFVKQAIDRLMKVADNQTHILSDAADTERGKANATSSIRYTSAITA